MTGNLIRGNLDTEAWTQGEHLIRKKAEIKLCFYTSRNMKDCQQTN